jgi:hypothetical protein
MTTEKYYRKVAGKTERVKLTEAETLALDLFFQNKLGTIEICQDYGKYKATINQETYYVTYLAVRPWNLEAHVIIAVRHAGAWRTRKVYGGRRLAEYKHPA